MTEDKLLEVLAAPFASEGGDWVVDGVEGHQVQLSCDAPDPLDTLREMRKAGKPMPDRRKASKQQMDAWWAELRAKRAEVDVRLEARRREYIRVARDILRMVAVGELGDALRCEFSEAGEPA